MPLKWRRRGLLVTGFVLLSLLVSASGAKQSVRCGFAGPLTDPHKRRFERKTICSPPKIGNRWSMEVSGPKQSHAWREWIASWNAVRGRRGGTAFAKELGLPPPLSAPRWFWKLAWDTFRSALGLLHYFDYVSPGESFLNLRILWWKAIAGNRRNQPVTDGGLAYDLLPPITRNCVRWPLCHLFPRLHHQLVVLRTAYLDRACVAEIQRAKDAGKHVIMVSLGAGYDTRSLRLNADQTIEMDLPDVIASKHRLFERRLLVRRPHLRQNLQTLISTDLNDSDSSMRALESALEEAAGAHSKRAKEERGGRNLHVLFVVEAVLMYPGTLMKESLSKY